MRKTVFVSILLMACGGLSFAQEGAQSGNQNQGVLKPQELTQEQREKTAAAHEQMAQCLRSGQPWGECHSEMMQQCREAGCPMMNQMMGQMMGPMMGQGQMGEHGGMMGHQHGGHGHAGMTGQQQGSAPQGQAQGQSGGAEIAQESQRPIQSPRSVPRPQEQRPSELSE